MQFVIQKFPLNYKKAYFMDTLFNIDIDIPIRIDLPLSVGLLWPYTAGIVGCGLVKIP
jgi:hypothetical protein